MTRTPPLRTLIVLSGMVAGLLMLLYSVHHLGVAVAHADPVALGSAHELGAPAPDPVDTANGITAQTWEMLHAYGPLWGAMLLVMGFGGILLRANQTVHWLARGRVLAVLTAGSTIIGAVLTWRFRSGDLGGLLVSIYGAIAMVMHPTVAPPTPTAARSPEAGRARLPLLFVLAAAALALPAIGVGGCAATQARVEPIVDGVVTCAKADVPAAKALGLRLATEALAGLFAGQGVPWEQLESEAAAAAKIQGVAVGSCAFGDLIADLGRLLPPPPISGEAVARSSSTTPAPLNGGRAALTRLKARLGVTAIDTGAGVL